MPDVVGGRIGEAARGRRSQRGRAGRRRTPEAFRRPSSRADTLATALVDWPDSDELESKLRLDGSRWPRRVAGSWTTRYSDSSSAKWGWATSAATRARGRRSDLQGPAERRAADASLPRICGNAARWNCLGCWRAFERIDGRNRLGKLLAALKRPSRAPAACASESAAAADGPLRAGKCRKKRKSCCAARRIDSLSSGRGWSRSSPALPRGHSPRAGRFQWHERSRARACHAIGYVGGKIGPDLTRIGADPHRATSSSRSFSQRQLRPQLRAGRGPHAGRAVGQRRGDAATRPMRS